MAFISYAQNFEDIMLWRALKHVTRGFYIDVGANDPNVDSVTKAFYDRGWRGINIEPMQQYQKRLRIERPNDINLAAAVGDSAGELTFYDVADTGLSTMDAAIAAHHQVQGKTVVERKIQILRLADICRNKVKGPIHFLKIDVEGFEAAVLRGMDFTVWRPWILVIEATLPQSQTRNTDAWQSLVLGAGYQLAYFDGLNDFYVADEHAELLPAFAAPPNYFDAFTLRPGHYYSHAPVELEHELWQANLALKAIKAAQYDTNVWAMNVDAAAKEVRAEGAMQREELAKARLEMEYLRMQLQAATVKADIDAHQIAEVRSQFTEARAQIGELRTLVTSITARAVAAEQLHEQSAAAIVAIYASSSWRLTRPIRVLKRWILHPSQAIAFMRAVLRRALQPAVMPVPVVALEVVASPVVPSLPHPVEPEAPVALMLDTEPNSVLLAAAELRRAIDLSHIAY